VVVCFGKSGQKGNHPESEKKLRRERYLFSLSYSMSVRGWTLGLVLGQLKGRRRRAGDGPPRRRPCRARDRDQSSTAETFRECLAGGSRQKACMRGRGTCLFLEDLLNEKKKQKLWLLRSQKGLYSKPQHVPRTDHSILGGSLTQHGFW